jgi:hypothetical protein
MFKLEPLSTIKAFASEATDHFITVKSKETCSIPVAFHPTEAKLYQADFRLKIQNNPFESTVISVYGEGFISEVTVDNLPGESDDGIAFGECAVGISKYLQFSLTNRSSSVTKFAWKPSNDFSISPSLGHIQV